MTAPLVRGPQKLDEVPWERALDEAEELLQRARAGSSRRSRARRRSSRPGRSGGSLREGLGAHAAVLPEQTSPALDRYRAPLSTIGSAQLIVVVGDEPVAERAPIVDLWIRAARRKGAEVVSVGVAGSVQAPAGNAAATAAGSRTRAASSASACATTERAVVIWSGPGGRGGEHVARLAEASDSPGARAAAPSTSRPRRTAAASPTRGPPRRTRTRRDPEPIGLLVVSGDEAAENPNVRVLAERADKVIVFAMYRAGSPPGRTSSSRRRATWSATGRCSTSRAACSASAAP